MLYEAKTAWSAVMAWDGSLAQAMSSATCLARSQSPARMASISATDGCGPMQAEVAQATVVVSGESRAKAYAVPSTGTKLMRRCEARSTARMRPTSEYFAAMTVGARSMICRQKAGGKSKRKAR